MTNKKDKKDKKIHNQNKTPILRTKEERQQEAKIIINKLISL